MGFGEVCERNLLRGLRVVRPWLDRGAWEAARKWICCALRCRFGSSCDRDFFKQIRLHFQRGLVTPCFHVPLAPTFLTSVKSYTRSRSRKPKIGVIDRRQSWSGVLRSFVYEEPQGLQLVLGSFMLPETAAAVGDCDCPLYGDEEGCDYEYSVGVPVAFDETAGVVISGVSAPPLGVSRREGRPAAQPFSLSPPSAPMAAQVKAAQDCLEQKLLPVVAENEKLRAENAALRNQVAELQQAPLPQVGRTAVPPPRATFGPQIAALTKERDDLKRIAGDLANKLRECDRKYTECSSALNDRDIAAQSTAAAPVPVVTGTTPAALRGRIEQARKDAATACAETVRQKDAEIATLSQQLDAARAVPAPAPVVTGTTSAPQLRAQLQQALNQAKACDDKLQQKDAQIADLQQKLAAAAAPAIPVVTGTTPQDLRGRLLKAESAANAYADLVKQKDAKIAELKSICREEMKQQIDKLRPVLQAASQCTQDLGNANNELKNAQLKNAELQNNIAKLQRQVPDQSQLQQCVDKNREVQDALQRAKSEIDRAMASAEAACPPPTGAVQRQLLRQTGQGPAFAANPVQGGNPNVLSKKRYGGGNRPAILYRPVTLPSRVPNPTLRPTLRTAGAFFSPHIVLQPALEPIHFPVRTPPTQHH